ncbi:U4/U6.U5 small nuclear ribonucleoprotein 27 kDa protein [Psilocybe cubensis]|uniref:U4/U6.U5 small nuclear ribonucleoprotein 27 kDa protein n=2 Tax=Psilocybe cubensis TaxID=181762 RepID=A0ACB8H8J2_PSICU|nr:U4/U6.U5 small nuclear ribonucleoprotein 27 kDa protein [Psilocybe cubensis]KAH9483982.1 U4/U6.U5 small nuclear ribonucleoprotein 27 kDa protein [Psilocybe cubensis]
MSSRTEPRRRDRSWEREDRGDRHSYGSSSRGGRSRGSHSYRDRDEPRRRSSRSRSPRRDRVSERRGGHERRDRDYRRDKDDDRRDRDRSRDRDKERERRVDDRRRDRDEDKREVSRRDSRDGSVSRAEPNDRIPPPRTQPGPSETTKSSQPSKPNLDPDVPDHAEEEGEAVDNANDDEAAMMAMMGVTGFGSTKSNVQGKHVAGNQEGAVNIKKERTWRQYMNRRGGFNRPLDKIK